VLAVLAVFLLTGAEVKFSLDQCRVLRQVGVDVRGICPDPLPKPRPKRTRLKR
jgi:hypothetical protein